MNIDLDKKFLFLNDRLVPIIDDFGNIDGTVLMINTI
jgi:hypothetical protein